MQFLQSPIGQRLAITLLALATLITSRFVPDFREMIGMAASAMFAWAWLKRPGDDAPEKSTKPKDPPPSDKTPPTGTPFPPAAAVLILLAGWSQEACGAAPPMPPPAECDPDALGKIEAAYIAEAVEACGDKTYDSCEALPEIRAKYKAKREAWKECGQ